MKRKRAKRPNFIAYQILALTVSYLSYILRRVTITYTDSQGHVFKKRAARRELFKVRPPYIILGNHSSSFDHVHTVRAFLPRRITFIVARKLFYTPKVAAIIRLASSIPKNLFQPDLETIRSCFDIIKSNGIIAMYPEAQIQVEGISHPISESAGKLLKKLGVPLITVRTSGSYFCDNTWRKHLAQGPINIDISYTANAEQVSSMSVKELDDLISKSIYVDNFAEQEKRGQKYWGLSRARGMENILYRCPSCGNEFKLKTIGNTIWCTECAISARYNRDMHFTWKNQENRELPVPQYYRHIGDWYQDQLQKEREWEQSQETFTYTCGTYIHLLTEKPMTVKFVDGTMIDLPATKRIKKVGAGVFTIHKKAGGEYYYAYAGTFLNSEVVIPFNPHEVTHIPYTPGNNFQIYVGDAMFGFATVDPRRIAQIALKVEAISEQLKQDQN